MTKTGTQSAFPSLQAALLLTLVAGALLAVTWLVAPMVFRPAPVFRQAALFAGVLAWLLALLSLWPVAVVGHRGVLPTVYAYFIGAALRLAVTLGLTVTVVYTGRLPARPTAAALAVFYLPLLMLEVSLVGRYLWNKDTRGAADRRAHLSTEAPA